MSGADAGGRVRQTAFAGIADESSNTSCTRMPSKPSTHSISPLATVHIPLDFPFADTGVSDEHPPPSITGAKSEGETQAMATNFEPPEDGLEGVASDLIRQGSTSNDDRSLHECNSASCVLACTSTELKSPRTHYQTVRDIAHATHNASTKQNSSTRSNAPVELELDVSNPLPGSGDRIPDAVLSQKSDGSSDSSSQNPNSSKRSSLHTQQIDDWTPESLRSDHSKLANLKHSASRSGSDTIPVSSLDLRASHGPATTSMATDGETNDADDARHGDASSAPDGRSESQHSDQTSSRASTSSTAGYHQEPFETFQFKAVELARTKIWPGAKEGDIEVERLRGGSYNRITGITRKSGDSGRGQMQYILRTPRLQWCDGPHAGRDAAALAFVRAHTQIPVPEVQQWEDGDSNAVESEYVVQSRLRGGPVMHIWGSLNHQQKCKVAQELGDMYRQLLSIRSSKAGKFVFIPDIGPDSDVHINPLYEDISTYASELKLPKSNRNPPTPFRSPVGCESVGKLYLRLIEEELDRETARQTIVAKRDPRLSYKCAVCRCDRRMAEELEKEGWFRNVHHCLVHRDLEARNIIVTNDDENSSKIISGIIDWDSAVLAPAFLACRPPTWLWLWDGSKLGEYPENHDESQVHISPRTPEALELKLIFEQAAGPIYLRFAYHVAYRVARRLFRFNMGGDKGYNELEEHEDMFKAWREFHSGAYEFDPDDIESFLPPHEGLVVSDDEEPAKCQ